MGKHAVSVLENSENRTIASSIISTFEGQKFQNQFLLPKRSLVSNLTYPKSKTLKSEIGISLFENMHFKIKYIS